MNGVKKRSLVLQFDVQSIMFLYLGYIDRHASILQWSAFGIPAQHPLAAKPPDRTVLFEKSEIISRCSHDVFIKISGSNTINKKSPVFRMNALYEKFQFIRKITLVCIAHQPAEAITPLHRCHRAVWRIVDNPASRLCQIGKQTDRCSLFFDNGINLFIACHIHKEFPSGIINLSRKYYYYNLPEFDL